MVFRNPAKVVNIILDYSYINAHMEGISHEILIFQGIFIIKHAMTFPTMCYCGK